MSIYDLSKEGVLRPEDLFKYRLKRDSSIPSKGGQKDFESDGSWLQLKRLEAFLQERTSILSEPRVEKLKNVVEGHWDSVKNLVNLKRPGKFWMHMGFTDERRNWLYPEEALFLMETNTLEVYHQDRPMSVQEAYSKLLRHGICLEEYQVFCHLRRLGYVVLRHEEERIFTDYERQINLNEYIDKKKRKEKLKKGKGKSSKTVSSNATTAVSANDSGSVNNSSTCKSVSDVLSTGASNTKEPSEENTKSIESVTDDSSAVGSKRKGEEHTGGETKNPRLDIGDLDTKSYLSDSESTSTSHSEDNALFYNVTSWLSCFKSRQLNCAAEKNGREDSRDSRTDPSSSSDSTSSSYVFPDVGEKMAAECPKLPPSQLLPPDMGDSRIEWMSDAEQSQPHFSHQASTSAHERNNRQEDFEVKQFSYLDRMSLKSKIKADSWSEYKHKKAEMLAGLSKSPVDHLWDDVVTPLMHPAEIESYKDLMDRLQIIQSADTESLVADVSVLPALPKISFDVHLPDHRFKKSMPGVPDHRVCVTRCDGVPPGLTAIQHLWSKYKDSVPLHWAVVDSGDIAFYVFDNTKTIQVLGP